jgi:hypothetical protein
MKIEREIIYTKIGPAMMAVIGVLLLALTLVSALSQGWPPSPSSAKAILLCGHTLAVCIIGFVLARGQQALVIEFWFDAGLAPGIILAALDWAALPLWLCGIFVVAMLSFWIAGIRKLLKAQHMNTA